MLLLLLSLLARLRFYIEEVVGIGQPCRRGVGEDHRARGDRRPPLADGSPARGPGLVAEGVRRLGQRVQLAAQLLARGADRGVGAGELEGGGDRGADAGDHEEREHGERRGDERGGGGTCLGAPEPGD